ncbi:MAG: preprotein translocase subunit SecG [Verrucomicrobiota bacterium JB022]|nr:preprotein translocase subunit SecG [Verrucomicrobiota bacterium JB022]
MLPILITFLTLVLIMICVIMVTAILMQRASSDAGMGAAMGGGAAESAFGAEAVNVLTRATKWSAIAFFVIAFGLYLLHMVNERPGAAATQDGDVLEFEEETAPAANEMGGDNLTLPEDAQFAPVEPVEPAPAPATGTTTAPAQ